MSSDLNVEGIYRFFSELEINNDYNLWYSKIIPPRYGESIKFIEPFLGEKNILELGSNPFLFSALLKEFFSNNRYFFTNLRHSLRLRQIIISALAIKINSLIGINLINIKFEPNESKFELKNIKTGKIYTFRTKDFDVEKDEFPYRDESMDLVLGMEILEHLREDPMFMIGQINRVLKKEGVLFLTTPNVISWVQLYKFLNMLSPQESPSYTPGGRGNIKEYTPYEVKQLLEAGGFRVERLETIDVGHINLSGHSSIEDWVLDDPDTTWKIKDRMISTLRKLDKSTDLRGVTVFALAKKVGPIKERYPQGIYTPDLRYFKTAIRNINSIR